MANIFEQYGIKEVADVMIYKINDDNTNTPYLFLDTLKVSTLEQTAEQTEARGGKGNAPLIIWDFGKEINITLEDALYSPRSMAMLWGGQEDWTGDTTSVERTIRYSPDTTQSSLPKELTIQNAEGKSMTVSLGEDAKWMDENGETPTKLEAGKTYVVTYKQAVTNAKRLTIGSDDFPGVYKIVGETYARNRNTGKDEYFQFIIHRAKLSAENTLTLEAEGDPTVFNLNLRTLRPVDGKMIELIQYDLSGTSSTSVANDDGGSGLS